MLPNEIRTEIDKIWEAFWPGSTLKPLAVLDLFTYLFFIRYLDEQQIAKEMEAAQTGQPIADPIYTKEQKELRWSYFKNADPERMYKLFTKEGGVFDFVKGKNNTTAFGKFMNESVLMVPTPKLLAKVVAMISSIDLKDRKQTGAIYEYLLTKLTTTGQNKQFITPPHITKLVVALMEPTPNDVIWDPSAGTGGFLVAAAQYVREKHAAAFSNEQFRNYFSGNMFSGMELDPVMTRIGAMNMILHGIDHPKLKDVHQLRNTGTDAGFTEQATLIMTTPPFSGSLTKNAFDAHFLKTVDSAKTELFFLDLILKGLKEGGRAAVIVPSYSVLGDSSEDFKQMRQKLLEEYKLEAIISLPGGVFRPYTGVSTAILILKKEAPASSDAVWYYNFHSDGLSLDDKRAALVKTGEGGAMRFPDDYGDMQDVLTRWKNRREEAGRSRSDKSFFVPVEEIKQNNYDLNSNRYRKAPEPQKQSRPDVVVVPAETLRPEPVIVPETVTPEKTLASETPVIPAEPVPVKETPVAEERTGVKQPISVAAVPPVIRKKSEGSALGGATPVRRRRVASRTPLLMLLLLCIGSFAAYFLFF